MLLIGQKKDWKTAKQQMSDAGNFLTMLKEFDVSKVKEATLKKIRGDYFSKKDFNPENILKKS